MKTIIIGNKKYTRLNIGKYLDSFDEIFRCNMSLPMGFNGTKHGSLGLCNHLYANLIENKLEIDLFKKKYPFFKDENIEYFFDNFKEENFNSCFYVQSTNTARNINDKLQSIGCPIKLKADPRTGLALCLSKVLSENKKIYISHFSIDEKEKRYSWYVKDGVSDSSVHEPISEIEILQWLHKNNKIDASLCLLKDSENIEFIEDDDLKPTLDIKKLLEIE